ncbi:unnamed protein product, partial [marine sediment metagenome]
PLSATQVGVYHPFIMLYLIRGTLGNLLSMIQDNYLVGDAH